MGPEWVGTGEGGGPHPSCSFVQASRTCTREGELAPRPLWTNSDAQMSQVPKRSWNPGLCGTCGLRVAGSQRVWFHEGGDAPAGDSTWRV